MSTTKKIMNAIAAIVLIMSVAMISFAFKGTEITDIKSQKFTIQEWYYTPNTVPQSNEIFDIDNYAETPSGICDGPTEIPCKIEFTESANYNTLEEYLEYQQLNSLPVNIVSYKFE